ncbi:MAG: PilZ domain-containing protein [Labilithrix sp.]|nr:PilZ domain-containing protein [Labilithrix sp.]MCW5834375.1 PilZ domain-containing protein [Labilithrix sp.]
MVRLAALVPPVTTHSSGADPGTPHFRAHLRRSVRLSAVLRSERGGWERSANVVDLHLAGAGVETDEPLTAGERVTIAFATPTLWDPLVLTAVVAWAHPLELKGEVDALGRPRASARAGLAFDYPTPDATLAMFEMLVAIDFE